MCKHMTIFYKQRRRNVTGVTWLSTGFRMHCYPLSLCSNGIYFNRRGGIWMFFITGPSPRTFITVTQLCIWLGRKRYQSEQTSGHFHQNYLGKTLTRECWSVECSVLHTPAFEASERMSRECWWKWDVWTSGPDIPKHWFNGYSQQ